MKRLYIVLSIAVILTGCFSQCRATENLSPLKEIFQIGRMNGNYMDFSSKSAREWMPEYSTKFVGGFEVVAGKKIPKDSFPGIQAGPQCSWGGGKSYPLNIKFKLDGHTADAVYALTIGLVGATPGDPAELLLSCNGKPCGSVAVAPGRNDDVLNMRIAGETSALFMHVPSAMLRNGDNTLTLTMSKGEWVVYDYLLLDRLDDPKKNIIVNNFTADAPPFLVKRGAAYGHMLRVGGFYLGAPGKATVTVEPGSITATKNFNIKPGPFNFEIILPEQSLPADAVVKIVVAGRELGSAKAKIRPVKHLTISLMPQSHLDIGYPDIQPNIVLCQRYYLDNALHLIGKKTPVPMTWVAEASWPVRNLLLGLGPNEVYGDWLGRSPLSSVPEKKFWQETVGMLNTAFEGSVSSTAGAKDSLNNRRADDGSPMGWETKGPARGASLKLTYQQPRAVRHIAIRQGREREDNLIEKIRVTFSDAVGKTKSIEVGPLGAQRERLLLDPPFAKIKSVAIEILKTQKDDRPAAIMELEAWENSSTKAERARLVGAIKSGRLEMTGMYLNFLTQLTPSEWLIRSMLRSQEVAAKAGVAMRTAMITDVPGFTFGLPDVLAGSGVKYFYTGINVDHAPNSLVGMPRAFYWQGNGGGRVMVYQSFNQYNEGWQLGVTIGVPEIERGLRTFLERLDNEKYPFDRVPLRTLGDITDDGPIPELLPWVVADWNNKWAFPKFEIGTPSKFFEGFEKKYGKSLPLMKGDWTSFWEDGEGSSALETIAIRTVHRDLLYAGAFGTFLGRFGVKPDGFDSTYARAEEGVYLYDEHTWGADNSVRDPEGLQTLGQWEFKRMPAWDAVEKTAKVVSETAPLFSRFAPAPVFGGKVFAVVNDLWFARQISVSLIKGRNFPAGVAKIIDRSDGREIAFGTIGDVAETQVVFITRPVPSFGVSYYEIVMSVTPAAAQKQQEAAVPEKERILENAYYRVGIDTGSGRLTSIIDKETGAELVDGSASYGMNEFVYVPGRNNLYQTKIQQVVVSGVARDARGVYVSISGTAKNFPSVIQTVRLRDDRKLIEFENWFMKDATIEKEGVYFAFPIKVPDGETRLEVTGGVMALEKDQLPGACRDWISAQDVVGAVGDKYSVMLALPDAPLVVPEEIRVMEFRKKLLLKNNTIFSYVMNNYWHTNYKAAQGGAYTFRYALTSVAGRAADSGIVRFGADFSSPARVYEAGGKAVVAEPVSFVSVEPANVRVLGVKPAEDGRGFIVRLQEMDGAAVSVKVKVHSGLNVASAAVADFIEKDKKRVAVKKMNDGMAVTEKISARGYLTLRLW